MNTQWINIEDQVPSNDRMVLVLWYPTRDTQPNMDVRRYDAEIQQFTAQNGTNGRSTGFASHWAELPKPPELWEQQRDHPNPTSRNVTWMPQGE